MRQRLAASQKREHTMSKIAAVAFAPSHTLFARIVVTIDRLLMAWAEANIRNGDVPRVGL